MPFLYTAYGPDADSSASIRNVRLLFLASTVVALFACFDFYFQLPAPAGYGPQFVWLDTGVYRRAQGLFYEASTLGNFCTFFPGDDRSSTLSTSRSLAIVPDLASRWRRRFCRPL